MKPFVSIVLPTYNREELIGRAINSVLVQSFPDWELIIVDDGSTDNTVQKLEKILKGNKKVRIFKQKNQGVRSARNTGIRKAKGTYVTFLDSDDHYKKNHLENYVREALLHKGIDLFYSDVTVIGDEFVPDIEQPGKTINIHECKVGGTFFAKRETLQKIGCFPKVSFGEDYYLFKKLEQKAYKTMKLPIKSYVYCRTLNNTITKKELTNKKAFEYQ